MMKKYSHLFILTLLTMSICFFTAHTQIQHKTIVDETSSTVPQLSELHEIIYPMWHQAFPEKNYELIKSYEPQIAKLSAEFPTIVLPGILREKKVKWDEAVNAFVKSAESFSLACKNNETQKLLDATEELHSKYEGMVRAIRPMLKELDAYHKILYVIYHKHLPDQNIDEIRKSSIDLAARCDELMIAKLPERLKSKAKQFDKAREALSIATNNLLQTAKVNDFNAIKSVVNDVHTKYQTVQNIFD